jgi:beta-galactosidase
MLRANLNIATTPSDTFLDMAAWSKGSIFVNGFPLGRHFYLGPQITSFIPAPLLKQGDNEVCSR